MFVSLVDHVASLGLTMDDPQLPSFLDSKDPLGHLREQFLLPPTIYFCGNSLGPQSKKVKPLIEEELEVWSQR